jgi:hypothetical protein
MREGENSDPSAWFWKIREERARAKDLSAATASANPWLPRQHALPLVATSASDEVISRI